VIRDWRLVVDWRLRIVDWELARAAVAFSINDPQSPITNQSTIKDRQSTMHDHPRPAGVQMIDI
jgi:hypothetical protein